MVHQVAELFFRAIGFFCLVISYNSLYYGYSVIGYIFHAFAVIYPFDKFFRLAALAGLGGLYPDMRLFMLLPGIMLPLGFQGDKLLRFRKLRFPPL